MTSFPETLNGSRMEVFFIARKVKLCESPSKAGGLPILIINEFKAAGYNHENRNEILEITHGFLEIVFSFHETLVRRTNGDKYLIIGCFDDIYVHELIILLCNKIRLNTPPAKAGGFTLATKVAFRLKPV